jgi:DNA-binding transcriptional ArsR family regulator
MSGAAEAAPLQSLQPLISTFSQQLGAGFVSYIDNHRFRVYCYLAMNSEEQNLNRFLQAVADPARRRILQALKERGGCSIGKDVGLCASDIELRVHLSQPTISHHMSILKKAGLVEAKKLGQWMWYRRNETALRAIVRQLRESL